MDGASLRRGAQRLTASEDGAGPPGVIVAGHLRRAQRLTASEDGAGTVHMPVVLVLL